MKPKRKASATMATCPCCPEDMPPGPTRHKSKRNTADHTPVPPSILHATLADTNIPARHKQSKRRRLVNHTQADDNQVLVLDPTNEPTQPAEVATPEVHTLRPLHVPGSGHTPSVTAALDTAAPAWHQTADSSSESGDSASDDDLSLGEAIAKHTQHLVGEKSLSKGNYEMHKLYQTIDAERPDPIDGKITGEIPDWLSGNLYRNGPGKYEVGEDKYQHWLDPLAMIQCFRIKNQKVTYESKYLQSDAYTLAMEANRIVVNEFGTVGTPDPCVNSFKRQLSRFEMDESTDNTNVSIFPLKDELYAATERNFINKIDPDTLDRLEKVKLEDYVAVNSATAHPHYDPDGTVHNLGNTYKGWPKTCIVRIPPKKVSGGGFPQGEVISSVSSNSKLYINYLHSFGMSENYYVFIEQPLHMSMNKIASTKIQNASLDWKPQSKPRFRVLDKKTGSEVNAQVHYEADTFMFMHHINTYEDNGHLIVDIVAYRKDSVLQYLYLKDLTTEQCEKEHRKIEDPEMRRYVIPLKIKSNIKTGTNCVTLPKTTATAKKRDTKTIHLAHERIADIGLEFPQINYKHYNTKKYKYIYGVGWHSKEEIVHSLVKVDVETKTVRQWKCKNCFPSEPVFVARPGAQTEDDGVLLSAICRTDFDEGEQNNAFLLVLDASDLHEIARADFGVPRFSKDLHGLFRSK